jgi:hypothetical protein
MIYLDAKPSHVGANVDGLAYSLDHPMVCSHQRSGQSFLIGTGPSHHAVVVWIFDVAFTIWVPVRSKLIWRSPLLPGHAYPTSKLSW